MSAPHITDVQARTLLACSLMPQDVDDIAVRAKRRVNPTWVTLCQLEREGWVRECGHAVRDVALKMFCLTPTADDALDAAYVRLHGGKRAAD